MNLTPPPSVTVLMVTYNASTYIYESINSVLNQTFTDFELLIYNDGSTDNTQDIVNSINDARIKYIHNETNKGLFYARNAALNAALGRYIAILDSDDIARPERLSIQYDFMEKNPSVALCGSNAIVIDSHGEIIDKTINKRKLRKANFKAELFFTNIFVNSSTIFRKDIALRAGGYRDMAPVEDYDLFIRIAEKHAIFVYNQAFVYYRRHNNNVSTKQSKIGDSYLLEIKKNQLDALNVAGNKYGHIFFGLLHWDYTGIKVNECLEFLIELKNRNRQLMLFPIKLFERKLFLLWYNFITSVMDKKDVLSYLLNSDLFSLSHLNMSQAKKVLKLCFKEIVKEKKK